MTQPADAAPRFVLLGELASGGMGSVDLVRMTDAWGERIAAMKRVHPHFARDAEFVSMFNDEILLTQGLHHENLVELLGWGEDNDGPYLVMEFVDGAPLAEVVFQARRFGDGFPQELAAYVGARMAEGLHAAHTLTDEQGRPLGLVHRDITPSNVLVGFDGAVKITDFGIAKAALSSSHTRTGIVKGKLEYMSPEHALRRKVDGRSDLYSLGLVLFEILGGEPPFCGGSDLELLKRVAYEPVPPLAAIEPLVDCELAALVDQLASKNPDDRPGDGATVAHALDAWLEQRGLSRPVLESQLAEHAQRFGAARHRRLRKLMAAEGMELGSSSSWRDPKRLRPGVAPAPGTFTPAASVPEYASGTRAIAAPKQEVLSIVGPPLPAVAPTPVAAVARVIEHKTGDRVTRRVESIPPPAQSVPPPRHETIPPPLETIPPPLETIPPPRESVPPPPRESIAAPPPSLPTPRWLPVVLGLSAACLLVALVFALTVGASRSAQPKPVPIASPPAAPPEAPLTEVAPMVDPTPSPPAETAPTATETAAPDKPPARAGQPKAGTAKVQSRPPAKSRSKPCTPDRFDYPACLGR